MRLPASAGTGYANREGLADFDETHVLPKPYRSMLAVPKVFQPVSSHDRLASPTVPPAAASRLLMSTAVSQSCHIAGSTGAPSAHPAPPRMNAISSAGMPRRCQVIS